MLPRMDRGHVDSGGKRHSSLFLPGEEEDQSERKLSSLVSILRESRPSSSLVSHVLFVCMFCSRLAAGG